MCVPIITRVSGAESDCYIVHQRRSIRTYIIWGSNDFVEADKLGILHISLLYISSKKIHKYFISAFATGTPHNKHSIKIRK